MAFCDFVKDLREKDHLTQAQMAEYLGVNINTIKQIEANKIKAPSMRVLDSFCEYLNEDRLTVITKILFRRDESVECDDEFVISQANMLSRYMSYLYLEGWNVDKGPVTYHTEDFGDMVFAGQLTKKREPNNKIVIAAIGAYFKSDEDNVSPYEAVNYILSMMIVFLCIKEVVLKGIHIVFDATVEYQVKLFKKFKALQINKVPFNYQMVLFDSEKGKVVDTIIFK